MCLAAACGGSSRPSLTAPSAAGAAPTPAGWRLQGTIVETLSGAPIAGATVSLSLAGGTRSVATNASGAWELTNASTESASIRAEVTAPGYVTRSTSVRWSAAGGADAPIDLIRDSGLFSLAYYRQLVRDALDATAGIQPLRRWTKTPNFYINTLNPATGQAITAEELETVLAAIREAVPQMTGGQFSAGTIDVGPVERAERAGVINVRFVYEPSSEHCGQARVGADPGLITLNYGRCQTPCGAFAPRTVAHEVGHALGFFHVDEGTVLNKVWYARDCANTTYSEAERHHARIAYARQPGNLDTDTDPLSGLLFERPESSPRVVTCR